MKQTIHRKLSQYDPAKIERKWQKKWTRSKLYKSKESASKKKYYVLDMFPYPSGEGLHVGHPKGYIATDVVSRMKRMQGLNVLHPMGFDAFGLPAENYAIKTKTNPMVSVAENVKRFKSQLEILGLDYDWSREVNTTDPEYYRWTQWIFLQLFNKGLAYESFEPINWCPSCKTGLANEDVEDGRCERCGTVVEKKPMRQWVLRITDYADRLLADLDAKNEPLFIDKTRDSTPRPDLPFVEREAIIAVVEHWSEDKFIGLKWKKVDWKTLLTGGVEKGQTPEEAARAEIIEETGYKNMELISNLGRQHAKFYHNPKKVNRFGHFTMFHFKLKNGEQNEITTDEQANHEIVWVPREEMLTFLDGKDGQQYPFQMILDRARGKNISQGLLDWPESIKELQRNWIGRSEGAQIEFRLATKPVKTRFVLIHGFEGNAHTNFFPWLKSELSKRGHEVEAPELPNPNNPTESEQVDFILKNCKLDENTVVIGHSLGSVVALKALMKLNKSISGLVLVAAASDPAFPDTPSKSFHKTFEWNYDFALIKKLTGGKISILSDLNEPDRMSYLKHLSKQLSARLVETKSNEEHFCANEEPEILKSVTPIVPVFTTRPDTIFGVTYLVLAPEQMWVEIMLPFVENRSEVEAYVSRSKNETEKDRTDATKEKTGVQLKGIVAINPANNEEVPVWIADYVLADYGTGAVMAVPAHDERDAEFAKKFGLPIREIKLEDKDEITEKFGRKVVKYKLRDWVFSRQRYWGEPIPLIHCEKCGVVAVAEKDLPVKLPKVKSYEPTGTGESPLAAIDKWVNVKCPNCKGKGKRETNTMPQWAGSCWYYLRYEDPKNKKQLVDPTKEQYWSPIDLYVGGAEHATRHLIYSRFWHKFLYDIGAVSSIEPFIKLQSVGLIMGEDGKKMSKRLGNVVNPDTIVATYGADTLRMYEMFMGPFDQEIAWSTSSMVGPRRFIERVWNLSNKVTSKTIPEGHSKMQILHKTIKKVTEDIESLRFNTAISSLMICANEMEKAAALTKQDYETFLKLMAPFAPHVTEELWSNLGNRGSIHTSAWPSYDPAMLVEESVTIALQVNGKTRGSFTSAPNADKATLEASAKAMPEAQKWLQGSSIKRVIVVPGKLVNIVV